MVIADSENLRVLAFHGGRALLLRHLASFAVNFAGGIFLARRLGPEILGLYFVSFSLLIIFREIIDFGIGIHLIRLPFSPSQEEIKTTFTLQQVLALLVIFISLVILAPLLTKIYNQREIFFLVLSAGIGAYFHCWLKVPLALLEREFNYKKVGLLEVADIVVFNTVAVVFVLLGYGIYSLVLGNIFRGLIPALVAIFIAHLRPQFCWDKIALKSLFNQVLPIVGANLSVWLIILAPPLVVGTMAGLKALGLAQMGYSILGYTMIIATISQRLSLVIFSRVQNDIVRFNDYVHKILRFLSLIYIPLVMGLASFSPFWVPLIYGSKWLGLEKVLLVASFPVAEAALLSVFLSALFAKGLAKIVFRQNIVHVVIYWLFILIFVKYGFKEMSVPFTHLIAIQAGCIFIWGYQKYCAKVDWLSSVYFLIFGFLVAYLSWRLSSIGLILPAVILWLIFITISFWSSTVSRKAVSELVRTFIK